jgi:hypothetical protein
MEVPAALVEAIKSFPVQREVSHCGRKLTVSPFDFYATCPHCGTRFKLRSFAASAEIEDVFDAVFEWLTQPAAKELMQLRQEAIQADKDE